MTRYCACSRPEGDGHVCWWDYDPVLGSRLVWWYPWQEPTPTPTPQPAETP